MLGYFTLLECEWALCSDNKYSMSQCLSVSLHVMSESPSTPRLSLFLLPLMPSLPGPVPPFLPSLLFIAKLPSCCPFLACVEHQHANVAPFLLSAPTTLVEWDREWKSITIALHSWHEWASSCQVSNLSASVPFQIGNCGICYKLGFE